MKPNHKVEVFSDGVSAKASDCFTRSRWKMQRLRK